MNWLVIFYSVNDTESLEFSHSYIYIYFSGRSKAFLSYNYLFKSTIASP